MLAVELAANEIRLRLGCPHSIVIACYDSPDSITLSGDAADILALDDSLAAEKIFARVLATARSAHHYYHMN